MLQRLGGTYGRRVYGNYHAPLATLACPHPRPAGAQAAAGSTARPFRSGTTGRLPTVNQEGAEHGQRFAGAGFYHLPDDEEQMLAEVRSRFGGQAVDAMRRNQAMRGQRPLTGDERAFPRAHMGPLFKDLAAFGAVLPDSA